MDQSLARTARGPRCIALVGPYLSGKTTLLEALLHHAGVIPRRGSTAAGTSVGDAAPEARAHGMSVELNAASLAFMGETFTFIDCPGSVEFAQDQRAALVACDAAIVVCEPDEKKIPALQLILKELDELRLPRFLFLNKIDKANESLLDVLALLQPASSAPLVLRQLPLWQNGIARGFVDLALERAFVYREHAESEVITMPTEIAEAERQARFAMLEKLADYDDALMEQLLSDMEPPRDRVFADLSDELSRGLITPVLLGSAENGHGLLRLLKAIRHEAPGIAGTTARLGIAPAEAGVMAQVLKTLHSQHGGKLSLARVLAGELAEGALLRGAVGAESRVAGLFQLHGAEARKIARAGAGDTVALGRLEEARTGETLWSGRDACPQLARITQPEPVYGLAISVADRKDEVKLTAAIGKLIEEDGSLVLEHAPDLHEIILKGQGEMHLRVAVERLASKFGVAAQVRARHVPYRETVRKAVSLRGRHKKQSGGHGQFGDVVLDIRPLPRGEGFAFTETISGGVVPRQYIPAVEAGVREALKAGPLGFPVVDVAVNLADGSYHSVDSSEMAFKLAARLAMSEGLPQGQPVLLEPVLAVAIHVPREATPRVNQIISGHRGQILGFDARAGWPGWDTVEAHLPDAETQSLIVDLRSATAGAASFTQRFDHFAEVTGKLADQVLKAHKAEAA